MAYHFHLLLLLLLTNLCLSSSSPTSDFSLIRIFQRDLVKNRFIEKEVFEKDEKEIFRGVEWISSFPSSSGEEKGKGKRRILPDPTSKPTVVNLAMMAFNAYENRNSSTGWKPVGDFNVTDEFGWTGDSLQGYVFGNFDRSILIMAIKGTTFSFFGEGGTSGNDKLMDNLMFSCCCAAVDNSWKPVCGCHEGKTCNVTCLSRDLNSPSMYFNMAQSFYSRLRSLFPSSSIWFTGHSLGGSLASLLAAKNRLSAFTYQAPGELLYAKRIGIPANENYHIFHYGNDADPIFLGTCQGKFSTCYRAGYAMETKCHLGSKCVYKGGPVTNINNHRIGNCIDRFYVPNDVPPCVPQGVCEECGDWSFV